MNPNSELLKNIRNPPLQAGRTVSQQFFFATFVTSTFFDANIQSHDTLSTAVYLTIMRLSPFLSHVIKELFLQI